MAKKPDVLEEVRKERAIKRHERAISSLRYILSTHEGKEGLWHIVLMSGFYADRILDSSSMIYAKAALRDFGRDLLLLLAEADENAVCALQQADLRLAVKERVEDQKLLEKESD